MLGFTVSFGLSQKAEIFRIRDTILHAGSGWVLPVPCLYVVRPDGQVVFAHADPDYTRRAEPEAILAALARLDQAAAASVC